MKTESTPGPYLLKNQGHYFRSPAVFGADGKQLVASAYGANQEELQANARLIAAAPDLLQALEEALPGIEELNGEFQEGWESTIDLIKKAINKAKGKSQ